MGIEAPYVEMPKQYLEKITYNTIPFVFNIKFLLNPIVKKIAIFQGRSFLHCHRAEIDKSRKSLNKNTSDTKAGEKTEEKEIFQRSLKSYKKYAQALISFYEKEPLTYKKFLPNAINSSMERLISSFIYLLIQI